MAKRIKHSQITLEIKKEYLKEHLDDVGRLITRWLSELSAPALLARNEGSWGWQSVYRPSIEQDPDSYHMIRKHLQSRTLWSHHANWEREMDHVWQVISQVREQTASLAREASREDGLQYHEDYLNTAICKGFDRARGQEAKLAYSPAEDSVGAKYGAYIIEMSAVDAETRSVVERKHSDLMDAVAGLAAVEELADGLLKAKMLEERMTALAGSLLKSRDILYSCKFCRHLWG